MLGLTREGIGYLESAAVLDAARRDNHARARIFMWLGMLLDGAPARAVTAYARSLEAFDRVDDPLWRAHTLMRSARVRAEVGEIAAARAALEEARPALESSEAPKALGLHADYMGFLRLMEGDPAGARECKERALRHYLPAGAEALALDTLGNLADVIWALGDLEAAIRAFRETIAMLRGSPIARKRSLGFTLCNFAGILIEHGDRREALAAAREGLPYLRDGGYAWIFMDHLAVCAILNGDPSRGALLAEYADMAYEKNHAQRQPNEARARARCRDLLAQALTPDALERLRADGRSLDPERAFVLALEG
jgi:tetratricopeptide (TPR) repeat protein